MRFITDQPISHTNAIDTQKTKKYHKKPLKVTLGLFLFFANDRPLDLEEVHEKIRDGVFHTHSQHKYK